MRVVQPCVNASRFHIPSYQALKSSGNFDDSHSNVGNGCHQWRPYFELLLGVALAAQPISHKIGISEEISN